MKNAILILAGAAIAGCDYPTAEDGTTLDEGLYTSLKVRKVRGHDYLVALYGLHGVSVVHAASCPCLTPKIYGIEELATTNRIPTIRDYIMEAQ